MRYNINTDKFRVSPSDCYETHNTICMTGSLESCSSANAPATTGNKLDLLLNPSKKFQTKNALNDAKRYYRKIFAKLNMKKSYDNIFKLLWSSQLPCFDSVLTNVSRSLLKKCKWKGEIMPCASIFDTFPTDRGMCCSFNIEKAENIFQESSYRTMINSMQIVDRKFSKFSTIPKASYILNEEPIPQAGVNKGLSLVLDAHTNLLAPGSVREDFQGFIAIIGSKTQYPLSEQKNIRIRPGYDNQIAISATNVHATSQLQKSIEPHRRGCYFHDEYKLVFHKNYSQANCYLECQMDYAKNMSTDNGTYCTPWFLPITDIAENRMCDPWDAQLFVKQMREIPDSKCDYCLPDCNVTLYDARVTAVPFRTCNEKNLGVSFLCNLEGHDIPDPPIFGHQVLEEYRNDSLSEVPSYVSFKDSQRSMGDGLTAVFTRLAETNGKYDAYQEDIASVKVYFDKSSVFMYSRDEAMTWVGFISQVGGLLGLCLGFSICSAVELLYWTTVRLWVNLSRANNKKKKIDNSNEKSIPSSAWQTKPAKYDEPFQ